MEVIYTTEPVPYSFKKSLFLAGPTPRNNDTPSWRPQALAILQKIGYDGVVFVPEQRSGEMNWSYLDQAEWEHMAMNASDKIVFWVPRTLPNMPAFTTNVEFGLFATTGKLVFGAPEWAEKIRYLKFVAKKMYVPQFENLEIMLQETTKSLGEGARREGGECQVPLSVWNMRAFQSWFGAQKKAGNRLDGARLEWISRVRSKPEAFFCFALHPNIHIADESRNKTNEPVIFRLDISAVVLYEKSFNPLETKIVLVKEFRSAASTKDGFIWELPGGSSPHMTNHRDIAVEEVKEEVGLEIDHRRLASHGARQLAGTLTTHKGHLFSAEITPEEMSHLVSQKGIPHGADPENPSGERTYTEVVTVAKIISDELLDWSNIGMILSVLMEGN